MFGLSGEHIVILLIILLIFGPRKLPEFGNKMGSAIKNFKDSINGVQDAKYRNLGDKEEAPLANLAGKKVSSEPAIAKKKDSSDDSSST
jgi:sec-independent protein translocase protein TatA